MTQMQSLGGRMPGAGQGTPVRRLWVRAAAVVAAVIIAAHGLAHLMGVALLWKLGQPGALRYADVVPAAGSAAAYLVGGLWLAAAVLFVAAGVLLAVGRPAWRLVALAAVAVSVPVIGLAPGQGGGGAGHGRPGAGPGRDQLAAA